MHSHFLVGLIGQQKRQGCDSARNPLTTSAAEAALVHPPDAAAAVAALSALLQPIAGKTAAPVLTSAAFVQPSLAVNRR